uniref:MARVEL domain-containing protein n=1 Tax=Strongyloides stercoralis TaxID=6248 RepID=A0A0K0E6Q6_STRER
MSEGKVNLKFLLAKPYGILLTGRVVLSAVSVICFLIVERRIYLRSEFNFLNGFFLLWSAISVLAHIFNLQKNLSKLPNSYFYIPFALFDFVFGLAGIIFFSFESLILIVKAVTRNYYFYNYLELLIFMLAVISTIGSGCIFGFYSLLLHVQTQNVKDLPIKEMVVEGDKITYFTATKEDSEKILP